MLLLNILVATSLHGYLSPPTLHLAAWAFIVCYPLGLPHGRILECCIIQRQVDLLANEFYYSIIMRNIKMSLVVGSYSRNRHRL